MEGFRHIASKSKPTERNAKEALTPDLLLQKNSGFLNPFLKKLRAPKSLRAVRIKSLSRDFDIPVKGAVKVSKFGT